MSTKLVNVGDIRLNVFDAGSGAPVLFAHGFPLDHTMWLAQLDRFRATHRVIAPDLRGFGHSDMTDGTVHMERLADDCAGLLDALGVDAPVVFCGLSMGGYVGWQFVRKHASRLRGLVQCDTKSAADTTEARQTRLKMAQEVLSNGTEVVAQAMLPKIFAKETFERRGDIIDQVRRMIAGNRRDGVAAAQRGMAARPDASDILPTIRVPTLVIAGEHDAISPVDEMRAFAAKIAGAEFAVIQGAGHMSPMENAAEFNRVLEKFLVALDEAR